MREPAVRRVAAVELEVVLVLQVEARRAARPARPAPARATRPASRRPGCGTARAPGGTPLGGTLACRAATTTPRSGSEVRRQRGGRTIAGSLVMPAAWTARRRTQTTAAAACGRERETGARPGRGARPRSRSGRPDWTAPAWSSVDLVPDNGSAAPVRRARSSAVQGVNRTWSIDRNIRFWRACSRSWASGWSSGWCWASVPSRPPGCSASTRVRDARTPPPASRCTCPEPEKTTAPKGPLITLAPGAGGVRVAVGQPVEEAASQDQGAAKEISLSAGQTAVGADGADRPDRGLPRRRGRRSCRCSASRAARGRTSR